LDVFDVYYYSIIIAIGTISGASARPTLAAFRARSCTPPGGIEENEWRAVGNKGVSP
jgi:hypothetical protein